jgi:DNA mismatch repair protein MutS2
MHSGTLRALEFDRVREALASFALTPLGAARLAKLVPSTVLPEVEFSLAETTEGVNLLGDAAGGGLPLRAPSDLDETLEGLTVEGRPLEALRLVALADFLQSIDQSRSLILGLPRERYPILAGLAQRCASFEREIADIRRAIDPAGDVLDNASPELRQIRDKLRRARSRLRGTLESYVRGRDTSRYLQDSVVTDRNGRYVLVVKAEHRGSIPGIVHGSSASGASLYLEPLATVEQNNEIVDLEEQEAEEIRRILMRLTDAFRLRGPDVARTLDAATELDVIQAKARLADICKASPPTLATDGRLELRGARHPLLINAVVARTADPDGIRVARTTEPVGVDVLIIPPTRVLVITGPNTGGKTVALKSAGLLSLMAQAGLHIPAEAGSQVPVFQSVFADIGDSQSIAANLSTFSWHITNIAAMDRALAPPALVLLDEVGAGTDPLEGGALGMAMIDHFRHRGAIVIATTHYDALKSYASTTPEVVAAAFGFTPETYAPTYRLLYGSPGTSLALEMAGRYGLPASIVTAARGFLTTREAQLSEHLAKIDRDLHALDGERRQVAREREQLAGSEAQVRLREEQLRQREEQFRRKLEDSLQERMREARRAIDSVVDDVKKKAAALADEAAKRAAAPRLVTSSAPQRLSTGEMGSLRTDARMALQDLADRLRRDEDAGVATGARDEDGDLRTDGGRKPPKPPRVTAAPAPPPVIPVVPGAKVVVGALGLEGIVQSVHDRSVEVLVRGKRLRAALDEVRAVAPAPGGMVSSSMGSSSPSSSARPSPSAGAAGASSLAGGAAGSRSPQREPSRSGTFSPSGARETGGGGDAGGGNRPRVTVNVMASVPEGGLHDLNVIGCTVPEAIERADKFLDQALLAEMHEIRLIHGHGTGVLRRALAEFLSDHPLVERFAAAAPNQGGGGVTVVELKD